MDETEAGGQVAAGEPAQAVSGEIVSLPESSKSRSIANLIPIRDPDIARQLQIRAVESRKRRKAIKELNTMRGVRAGVAAIAPNIRTFGDAWRWMSGQMAQATAEGDSRAYLALHKAAGFDERDAVDAYGVPAGGALLVISPELIAAALSRMRGE